MSTSFEIRYIAKPIVFKKSFLIGKYEVSNELWALCNREKGCVKNAIIKTGETFKNPVARVNWHDAQQFAKWYSKKTGSRYRLPTEEEWSFAANMGKDQKPVELTYDYESLDLKKLPEKATLPVGHYGSNAWGMSDILGNVWEWTLSCWFAAEENILKERSIEELSSTKTCPTRIAVGETRSHIPDFISDTYGGGCATLRPAANLGFRLVKEEN